LIGLGVPRTFAKSVDQASDGSSEKWNSSEENREGNVSAVRATCQESFELTETFANKKHIYYHCSMSEC